MIVNAAGEFDVVIVGAGAAGLAAGRHLMEAGASVLIVEARERIGGRSLTRPTWLGHSIDLGCEWLHSADHNPWTRIARGMGLSIDENLPDWGSRVSRHEGSEAQSDWGSAYADFADRLEVAAQEAEDRPASDLLTAGGRWNALVNAVSTWANGVELDRLSVQDHARYADSGVNWRVFEGYGALIAAYGSALPIHTSTVVQKIDHGGTRLGITTNRGTLRARAGILTVPTTVLASEAIHFSPPLPDKITAAHGLPLGVANKLFLELNGAVEEFAIDRHIVGTTTRAATGSYQLRPHGWPMIACFFGGNLAIALEREGATAMTAFALDELAELFGNDIRHRLRPLAASAWETDPFARGSYSYALPGHAGDRARLAAPVDGRLFFAGEACSSNYFSTAQGAYLTGRAAADQVIVALAIAPRATAQQQH
jgi:monoamine oxidase